MSLPEDGSTTPVQKVTIHKRLFFLALTILLSFFVTIVLGEIFLRVIVRYNLCGEQNGFTMFMKQVESHTEKIFGTVERTGLFQLSEDPSIKWEPIPGSSAYRGKLNIRINSAGFRGKEYEKETGPGVVRVVFLGDSDAFGLLLKQKETVPGCVERYLNDFSSTNRFEVLNFGVPGYNTAQEFAVLKKKAVGFNPSIVVLYYVLNDPIIADPCILVRNRLLARSYLYLSAVYLMKSWSTLNELDSGASSLVDFYQRLHSSEYFVATRGLILEMEKYLEQHGIRFILVIDPEVIGFENWEDYPYRNIHEQLRALASKNIEIVDPLEHISSQGHAPKDYWVTAYDCHKNPQANDLIGHYIAKHIVETSERLKVRD
jgi:hypothetical protein